MTSYEEARRADIAADREFADRLNAADDAGDLTVHTDNPCQLGSWHTGPCPRPTNR